MFIITNRLLEFLSRTNMTIASMYLSEGFVLYFRIMTQTEPIIWEEWVVSLDTFLYVDLMFYNLPLQQWLILSDIRSIPITFLFSSFTLTIFFWHDEPTFEQYEPCWNVFGLSEHVNKNISREHPGADVSFAAICAFVGQSCSTKQAPILCRN